MKKLIYVDEKDFREAIVVPWLRKKEFRILRQHGHGMDEQGKDLIIEDKSGRIGACVIKPKIHGQYSKEGNIEEIRNQISAAFNVPFPDYINKDRRRIDFVFIISKNKITLTAKENIIESFKENKNIAFYSSEDILEEYYALPLKIREISLSLDFCPKNKEELEKIRAKCVSFDFYVCHSGDDSNFGIFSRTHHCGKIKEVTMTKKLRPYKKLLSIDIDKIYNFLKENSAKEPLVSFFIYFEEDNIEKIENFFKNYIEKEYNAPVLEKESGKITVYFGNADLDKFKKLVSLLKKWL